MKRRLTAPGRAAGCLLRQSGRRRAVACHRAGAVEGPAVAAIPVGAIPVGAIAVEAIPVGVPAVREATPVGAIPVGVPAMGIVPQWVLAAAAETGVAGAATGPWRRTRGAPTRGATRRSAGPSPTLRCGMGAFC